MAFSHNLKGNTTTNAREELLEAIEGKVKIVCSALVFDGTTISLKVGHSEAEYSLFMQRLNFTYDAGYGSQYLFGMVWLEDGSWLSRKEYDGSEWWVLCRVPEIPVELLN